MAVDFLDSLEQEINNVDTDLTAVSTPRSITYPFIYVEDVSKIEFDYLRRRLPKGDIPLMIKSDNMYASITYTTISLEVIKHLSRFKSRDIFVKKSKKEQYPIEDMLDMLLLEE